jgi:putative spermidine/putrescine transport system ATP-binding protein
MPNETDYIRFEDVTKRYAHLNVIERLNFSIAKGEFISLLGPSGSGKSTLLMILAGFEAPSSGSVWLNGRRIEHVPAHRRNMGIVFQNYALFPHMTAAENIAFPLRRRGVPKARIAADVARALDMVQLSHLSGRKPSQMSGGQQQRIALARALVFEPQVVLMDEPLGALDKQLREQMQLDIRALHRRLGLTIMFVTHDQSEALTMSDRIAIFDRGRIEQVGTPEEVYDRPASRFVSEFIGETNLMHGTVGAIDQAGADVVIGDALVLKVVPTPALGIGQTVSISIRPERLRLAPRRPTALNAIDATIVDAVYQGDHLRISAEAAHARLVVRADRQAAGFAIGERIQVEFAPADCWVIPA